MDRTIIEFEGIYGGSRSRDVVLRVLKEALALVENTEPGAELTCSGFRIEETGSRRSANRESTEQSR